MTSLPQPPPYRLNRTIVSTADQQIAEGTLALTDAAALAGQAAYQYRNEVMPPLPKGFKREEMSFSVSEEGRVLRFYIRDVKQEWKL